MPLKLLILILPVMIFPISCSQRPAAQKNPVTPYVIKYSEGGGFTGLVRGYDIASSGEVVHWELTPGAEKRILWKENADQSQIQGLREILRKSGIFDRSVDQRGNMTTVLGYESGGQSYSWSWPGSGPAAQVPEELREFIPELLSFCHNLKNDS